MSAVILGCARDQEELCRQRDLLVFWKFFAVGANEGVSKSLESVFTVSQVEHLSERNLLDLEAIIMLHRHKLVLWFHRLFSQEIFLAAEAPGLHTH